MEIPDNIMDQCHAPGCPCPFPVDRPFCDIHWSQVAPDHQEDLAHTYKPGARPSFAYMAALTHAKADIMEARREGSGEMFRKHAEIWRQMAVKRAALGGHERTTGQ